MAKTLLTLLLLSAVGAAASSAPDAAPTAASASPTVLYDGKAVSASTLSVASWGGGSGQESAETYIFGGHSLKVTTLDLYQGARISLAAPVSLAGDNRVFQLTLRRGGAVLHYDPQAATAGPFGGNGFGGPGVFGPFYGRGGRNGRRRRNPTGPTVSAVPLIPPVSKLRLQFTLADGRQADVVRAIPETSDAAAGEGWYSVNVPISSLGFGAGAAPMLKSVTVGGDHYGVFFVGRIQMTTDAPTMTFTIDGPEKAVPGQPVALRAKGDPGLSTVSYQWDLGADTADPAAAPYDPTSGLPPPTPTLQVMAGSTSGAQIAARYLKPGDYTVTLTVTDNDGIKKPVTVIKTLHVAAPSGPSGNRFAPLPNRFGVER